MTNTMTGNRPDSVTVTLLTKDDCALCEHAKTTLARIAGDHPMTVEQVDMASGTGQALAEKTGILFAPGVLIDGEPFSHGRLSERRLRRELERRPTSIH